MSGDRPGEGPLELCQYRLCCHVYKHLKQEMYVSMLAPKAQTDCSNGTASFSSTCSMQCTCCGTGRTGIDASAHLLNTCMGHAAAAQYIQPRIVDAVCTLITTAVTYSGIRGCDTMKRSNRRQTCCKLSTLCANQVMNHPSAKKGCTSAAASWSCTSSSACNATPTTFTDLMQSSLFGPVNL